MRFSRPRVVAVPGIETVNRDTAGRTRSIMLARSTLNTRTSKRPPPELASDGKLRRHGHTGLRIFREEVRGVTLEHDRHRPAVAGDVVGAGQALGVVAARFVQRVDELGPNDHVHSGATLPRAQSRAAGVLQSTPARVFARTQPACRPAVRYQSPPKAPAHAAAAIAPRLTPRSPSRAALPSADTSGSVLLPPLASLRCAVPSLAGEREQRRLAKTSGVVPMLALTRLEGTRRSRSGAPRCTE